MLVFLLVSLPKRPDNILSDFKDHEKATLLPKLCNRQNFYEIGE